MSYPRRQTTDDLDRQIHAQALQEAVAAAINEALDQEGISRLELAERIGVAPSRVTRILSGDFNLTLSSIAETLAALNHRLHVSAIQAGATPSPQRSARIIVHDSCDSNRLENPVRAHELNRAWAKLSPTWTHAEDLEQVYDAPVPTG